MSQLNLFESNPISSDAIAYVELLDALNMRVGEPAIPLQAGYKKSPSAGPLALHYTHTHMQGRIYDSAGVSPALTATASNASSLFAVPTDNRIRYAVRRLTPLECERLQGFPDGWTEGLSDTQRYKALGNGVAVPVVEWIIRRIVKVDRHA